MLKEKKLERDEDGALILPIEVCEMPDIPAPHRRADLSRIPDPPLQVTE
jgi:hypothetical protein